MSIKYSNFQAPNGKFFEQNDIDYLMNNGYTLKDALEELSVNSQQWNYSEPRSRANPSPKRERKFEIKEENDLRTSFEKLSRKIVIPSVTLTETRVLLNT